MAGNLDGAIDVFDFLPGTDLFGFSRELLVVFQASLCI
jgi:hypothetical protein